MAITIIDTPDFLVVPVYNTIAFTVNSSNKTQCNFKYICDVYANGALIKRLKLFPAGANGYATFKVNRVLSDLLSYDLHDNLYGNSIFAENNLTALEYQLKFGEEYDSSSLCDAGTTIFPNLTLSSTYQAFNGALQKKEWLDWNDNDYYMTSSAGKFLTHGPYEQYISWGSQATLNFINRGAITHLEVNTYNSSGGIIGTYTFNNAFNSSDAYYNRILTVGVGIENLNNSVLLSGVQPVITDDVIFYTVALFNGVNQMSELKRYTIDNRYSVYDPHRIWFLNRLGGFDSYTYTLKDNRKVDIQRSEFTKIFGAYTSSPSIWNYQMKDRGRTTLNVSAQERERFQSNWLTEFEALWMENLFTTIEAYEQEVNRRDCFLSVTVSLDPDTGATVAYIVVDDPEFYSEGDTVYVEKDSGSLELEGEYTVSSVDSGGIYLDVSFDEGSYSLCACLWKKNHAASFMPLIITSGEFEEKTKNKVKNINYVIEVEPAHAINLQRN